jgi:acyl-lipid omega-6 desaturase (Delta-12 desaturase)
MPVASRPINDTAVRLGGQVRHAAARFAQPIAHTATLQLLTSFGPFLAGCLAMYFALPSSLPLALALSLPTGALLVRVFIVQHDCGHGSFFASRRANTWVGRLCSLFTLAPYANWSRQHGVHHALSNNIQRMSESNDLFSTCVTVRDYLAMSRHQRLLYRLPRHPLVANVLLPPLVFLLVYRLPLGTPRHWLRERLSVLLSNLSLVGLFGGLAFFVGWQEVLLVHLSIMVVASILGIGLFSLQHRFETARWMDKGTWNVLDTALHGSSWLRLPAILQWLTGNIGFHHVHHLNPRVPNYRLERAHAAVQALAAVPPVFLGDICNALTLTLWDEAAGKLVAFRDVVA